ncbi:tRNA preQ1(34) S-adenosylmethionine ribosyltransferase-isomerase QueA [Gammaproteobacteria bacterium]|nr:tRNA preQ1(34) S-adenosylmethionine ribosyltransferase-isomerase QueA [Gammaproteobacteria bacterium]MDB9896703.1 tRNA preQ1(34) S-adenosylmethionine ribosyltransferase-isomerase QueA [Gammaproteobacteria bacterium]
MKTEKFNYDLPEHLIAQYPLKNRVDSKLLACIAGIEHKNFKDVLSYMDQGDLLVVNKTSVIPARLFGEKSTGGKVEIFLERFLSDHQTLVQIKSSRTPKENAQLVFYFDGKKFFATIEGRQDNFFILDWEQDPQNIFQLYGEIPLPPYMHRSAEKIDEERYETVYADFKNRESVAAPTAGMHFDDQLLDEIKNKGIDIGYVNLQVGAGTFQPVKTELIAEHQIHKELIEVDVSLIEQVNQTKARGGKIIAVGTTSVRALETACQKDYLPFKGETQLFIYPGYEFKVVDLMITNFHLPKSSLLMLVAAFIGYEKMIDLYQLAIEKEYRFLSYGDAMILKKHEI